MINQALSNEELIQCEICLTEIPASDAETAETADYVAHFCGLECYQQWHDSEKKLQSEKTG